MPVHIMVRSGSFGLSVCRFDLLLFLFRTRVGSARLKNIAAPLLPKTRPPHCMHALSSCTCRAAETTSLARGGSGRHRRAAAETTSLHALAFFSVEVNHGWQWAVMIMSSLNHSWRWSLSYPSTPPSTSRKRRRWPASVTTASSTAPMVTPRTTPPLLPKMNPSSNHFSGPKVPPRSSSFACCSPCLWDRRWVSFRRL